MTDLLLSNGVWLFAILSIVAPWGYLIASKKSDQIAFVVLQYIISLGMVLIIMSSTVINTRYIIKHIETYSSDGKKRCHTSVSGGSAPNNLIITEDPIGAVGDTLWLKK